MAEEGEVNVEKISFIRNVYSIIIFQLLVTAAVVSVVVLVHPVDNFLDNSIPPPIHVIVLCIVFMIGTCCIVFMFAFYLLDDFHQKYLLNHFLLLISSISIALPVGLICAFVSGKIILGAVTLTTAVVISLSLYIFWAAKRNHDISFLGSFLYGALLVLILVSLFQVLLFMVPLGKLSIMVYYGCVAPIIIYSYIVYDMGNVIKGFCYARYIRLSVSLYLDAMFLFASLLAISFVAEFIQKKI